MRANTSLLALVIALGLTFLALVGHSYLPEKRLVLLPTQDAGVFVEPYSDDLEGGPSHSERTKEGDSYLWTCKVADEGQFNYCGLSVVLAENYRDGIDLTGYHSVRVRMQMLNHKKGLRLVLRHYDYRLSDPLDANSAQFSTFNIRHRDLDGENDKIQVGFSEFGLADWWVVNRDLPRDLMQPAFSNIVLIGMDYGEFMVPGRYEVRLDGIEVVGDWVSAENWYLSILLVWLLGLTFWVVHRLVTLRQVALRNRIRLEILANRNEQLKQESHKYREMSTKDPLTGALNRFGFEQLMVAVMHQPASQPISLILLDIDHFKEFNDLNGHDAGDKVLKKLVELLHSQTRNQDMLCRWGGEEFLLLCPQTNAESAMQLAEKIREVIANVKIKLEVDVTLTASFGVCEIGFGEPYVNAFARVDQALYRAKDQGRDRVVLARAQ